MTAHDETLFEAFLNQHDDEAWNGIISSLLADVHEVDRTAVQIWFFFFPLALNRALREAEDPNRLASELLLEGNWSLKDQIDTSHRFLYGHRYWPEVRRAVAAHSSSAGGPSSLELSSQVREVASSVARELNVDPSLVLGITAVAFMTLQQVGAEAFKTSPGSASVAGGRLSKAPEKVLKERARDDFQGPLGYLRGPGKRYTLTFDENDPAATFTIISCQEMTTAAANDKRDHTLRDPRCMKGEGPIPIQCRSAACGTCWVGVLAGAEKLSDVDSLESRRIKEFGYIDTDDPKPLIRLACKAQALGAVSIVIPPWNGVFGRFIRHWKKSGSREQLTNS